MEFATKGDWALMDGAGRVSRLHPPHGSIERMGRLVRPDMTLLFLVRPLVGRTVGLSGVGDERGEGEHQDAVRRQRLAGKTMSGVSRRRLRSETPTIIRD